MTLRQQDLGLLTRVEPPLFYVVDWLPPDFGAVGQYGLVFARALAAAGRSVCLIGLTSGSASVCREACAGGGVLEIRRIASARYDKSRYLDRIIWTVRTNLRLMWEVIRTPAS